MSSRRKVKSYYSKSPSTHLAKQRAIFLHKLIHPPVPRFIRKQIEDAAKRQAVTDAIRDGLVVPSRSLPSLVTEIDAVLKFVLDPEDFPQGDQPRVEVTSNHIQSQLDNLIFIPNNIQDHQNAITDWHVDAIEFYDSSVDPQAGPNTYRLPKINWQIETGWEVPLTPSGTQDTYYPITINDDVACLIFNEPQLVITSPENPHSCVVKWNRYAHYYDWFGPVEDTVDMATSVDDPNLDAGDVLPYAFFRKTSQELISKLYVYKTYHQITMLYHVAGIIIPTDGVKKNIPSAYQSIY